MPIRMPVYCQATLFLFLFSVFFSGVLHRRRRLGEPPACGLKRKQNSAKFSENSSTKTNTVTMCVGEIFPAKPTLPFQHMLAPYALMLYCNTILIL